MNAPHFDTVTVTLNPAIDRTVTIPNFTAGAVNRVEAVRSNPGGKGVNVAASLADAGQAVAVTGFLGRENPASFEALFADMGIADHFVRIAGQTRVGIKVSDPVLNQTTDINFPGATATTPDLDALRKKIGELDAGCFVLAGSLPPGVEATIYRDLIIELRARGRRVVLDASGEALHQGLEAKPHLFKPNIYELGELLGESLSGEDAVIKAARQLIARGLETVVVSMGKDGACFVTANEAVIARPPDVEVRSTVGAGDAMVAGIIAAQARRLSLADCARLDLALHRCERAADAVPDTGSLELLGHADPSRLRLRLLPGVAVLASAWPVASIHAAHARGADDAAFDVARERIAERLGESVVVARDGWRAVVHPVAAPALAFMQALSNASDLARALDVAGDGFDFAAWLADGLRLRWLQRVEHVVD